MATEIYVLHPGVGQNRPVDGAAIRAQSGTNFAYVEQQYADGVDRISFFQAVAVPPGLDTSGNVTIRTIWRQISAAVTNDLYVDLSTRSISPPDDRDDTPLTFLGPQTVTMTGTVGQESFTDFTLAASGLTPDDELLVGVKRIGSSPSDNFGGVASLVSVILKFPLVSTTAAANTLVYKPGGVAGGNVYTVWDSLFTAAGATSGPVTVQIDTSLGAALISGAGAPYDLSNIIFVGLQDTVSTLGIGATLSEMPLMLGKNMILNNTLAGVAFTSTGTKKMFAEHSSLTTTGGGAIIDVSTGTFNIEATDFQLLTAGGTPINVQLGADFDGNFDGRSVVETDTISGAGDFTFNCHSSASSLDDQSGFGSFTGTPTINLINDAAKINYDNTISGLSSTNVKDAIDELASGGSVSKWADPGAYIYPVAGASKEVVIGDTTAPAGGEKLRVRSDSAGPAVRAEGDVVIADEASYTGSAGEWNGPHFVMGPWHFWVDSIGDLRISSGSPGSEFAGEVIGSQGG